ncbi:MAG: hypothetical protein HUU06_11580, partial [Planctomycetaceae bacterium]|nr:hypothetical protein [Planctomycetaceae bacterium]
MEEVVARTRPRLLAAARRIGRPQDAEDSVQSAYLSLVRKRGEPLEAPVLPWLLTAVIRIATPLIFATLGELVCERAGVLNLGIEGIMVAGAFAGWFAVWSGAGLWAGVAVAFATGMAFGLLHALLTVPLGLS